MNEILVLGHAVDSSHGPTHCPGTLQLARVLVFPRPLYKSKEDARALYRKS